MHSPAIANRHLLLAIAFLPVGVCSAAAHAQLQANLPPTAPTSMPAPIAASAPSGPIATKPRKATVTYAAGLLDVRANDSSLNSILREISRLTGMTISGGVADQRVFGNYGPAEPGIVIATLLDGTGTNLFLKASSTGPAELVLTPRAGGPTPPSPSTVEDTDDGEVGASAPLPAPAYPPRPQAQVGYSQVPPTATQQAPPLPTQGVTSGPQPAAPPLNNVLGSPNAVSPTASTLPVTNSMPVDAVGTPSTATPVSGIVDTPAAPAAGSTTAGFNAAATANAASRSTPTNDTDTTGSTLPGGSTNTAGSGTAPNGVRTPEEIFRQLQQRQRATQASTPQGAQSGTAAPASTTTTNGTQPASTPR